MATEFTGGIVPNATRIDSACFTDGDYDNLIIEFWAFSGSILCTVYDRRTTVSTQNWVPTHTEAYARLRRMADGENVTYSI